MNVLHPLLTKFDSIIIFFRTLELLYVCTSTACSPHCWVMLRPYLCESETGHPGFYYWVQPPCCGLSFQQKKTVIVQEIQIWILIFNKNGRLWRLEAIWSCQLIRQFAKLKGPIVRILFACFCWLALCSKCILVHEIGNFLCLDINMYLLGY